MTPKALCKAIEAKSKQLAKVRDELRYLIADGEQIRDDCDEAIDLLKQAADKLSEMQ